MNEHKICYQEISWYCHLSSCPSRNTNARAHFLMWFLLALLMQAQPRIKFIPKHTQEKEENMTLALCLNKPDLHQCSRAPRWNHASHHTGSYVRLFILWRWSAINSPHPRYPQSRRLIKASFCLGDPICQNSPGSCWSIILLWTSAHSPQYCLALQRVYATMTSYLCLRHMYEG